MLINAVAFITINNSMEIKKEKIKLSSLVWIIFSTYLRDWHLHIITNQIHLPIKL